MKFSSLTSSLFRSGIGRDFSIAFLLIAVAGFVILGMQERDFQRQGELANLVNQSGRLRMLAQTIALATDRVARGDNLMRTRLAELLDEFDHGLGQVEEQGRLLGIFGAASAKSNDVLSQLKTQWDEYHSAATALTTPGQESQRAGDLLFLLGGNMHTERLLTAAEATVQEVLARFSEEQRRFRQRLLITGLLAILAACGTFIYVHRRLLQPMQKIADMSHRFADGNLDARIEHHSQDDLGRLIATLNNTAQQTQQLVASHTQALLAVKESEQRNRMLWETSSDAIIMIDGNSIIQFANPAVAAVFGHQPEDLLDRHIELLQPERLRAAHREGIARYQSSGERHINWRSTETIALHKSGREIPVELSFSHLHLLSGPCYAAFFRDISQRIEAQSALRLRNRAIESAGEGIMINDARTEGFPILYVNPALERITGYTSAEVIGHNGSLFIDSAHDTPAADALRLMLHSEHESSMVLQCLRKDGTTYWNDLTVSPVRDDSGSITHTIGIVKDVTERKLQEEALVKSATYDFLTGLPNRTLLQDRLDQAIVAAQRYGRQVGLLFIDLDHFKFVNDSFGHDLGDALLRVVGRRLQNCMRDGDTVARLGGDEFVVMLRELEKEDGIIQVAEKILESLAQPIELDGREIFVGSSIGGSLFPRDGNDANELLQRADIAMYRAKEEGRNRFQLYADEMQSRSVARLSLETKLRKALERDEFVVYYQPQISLDTGRIVGAEALIRWQNPEMGLIPPINFIPLAEETGLIVPIGEWVLDTACHEAKRWATELHEELIVAVNLSARQFRQNNLLDVVARTLGRHGLPSKQLELELTESLAMRDPKATNGILAAMKEMGLHLALDDFGTGYSSLAYLKNFPVDRLKIDKSFVQDVIIVGAVIQLAKGFNLETVAEGVENEFVLRLMRHLGCTLVQGYLTGRPMPAAEFSHFVEQHNGALPQ